MVFFYTCSGFKIRSICCYTYFYNKYYSISKCLNETIDHTYTSKNSSLQKIE